MSRRPGPWAGSLAGAVRAAGGSLDADAAAVQLFRPAGGSSAAARRVVQALASVEPGLRLTPDGRIALAEPQSPSTPLAETTFVVVDVETTGSVAGSDRIIEIGAVRIARRRIVDTYSALVQPGRPVPAFISRLTGIDELLLRHAPGFAGVQRPFLDFLGNAAFVAHNVGFDLRFLDCELQTAGEGAIVNPVLCTVKLSRRLLPHLRSCSLDSLAAHFGQSFTRRHRALADAEVTARILIRLLEMVREAGAASLEDLVDVAGLDWRRRRRRG